MKKIKVKKQISYILMIMKIIGVIFSILISIVMIYALKDMKFKDGSFIFVAGVIIMIHSSIRCAFEEFGPAGFNSVIIDISKDGVKYPTRIKNKFKFIGWKDIHSAIYIYEKAWHKGSEYVVKDEVRIYLKDSVIGRYKKTENLYIEECFKYKTLIIQTKDTGQKGIIIEEIIMENIKEYSK